MTRHHEFGGTLVRQLALVAAKVAMETRDNRRRADSHVTRYRPDLDGLRALAVVAVIAFHLSRGLLPGGYLGVDIFFVLSGYLITSIIWREIALNEFTA